MPDDPYISLKEAKQLLCVSEQTVRRMFDRGEIRGFVTKKVRGHRRLLREDVLALQQSRLDSGISFPPKE